MTSTMLQEDVFFVEMALSMCNFQFGHGKEKTERSDMENRFYLLWLKANYNKLRESLKEHRLFKNMPVDMNDDELMSCDKKCELCLNGMFFSELVGWFLSIGFSLRRVLFC